jgi:hypothetical protein
LARVDTEKEQLPTRARSDHAWCHGQNWD